MDPIERAQAFQDLVDGGMLQGEVARQVGTSVYTVSTDLALLRLPKRVRELVAAGELTRSHAKALIGLEPKNAVALAEAVVKHGYSSTLLRDSIREVGGGPRRAQRPTPSRGGLVEDELPLPVSVQRAIAAASELLEGLDAIRMDPTASKRAALPSVMERLRTALASCREYGWAA